MQICVKQFACFSSPAYALLIVKASCLSNVDRVDNKMLPHTALSSLASFCHRSHRLYANMCSQLRVLALATICLCRIEQQGGAT